MDFARLLQIIITAVVIGGIYALIALGLNLVYGTMRLLNVAHGELIVLGAYTAYWFLTVYNLSPLVSIFFAAVICAAIGVLVFNLIFERLVSQSRDSRSLESSSLLIFFGLSIIMQNLGVILWTADIRSYSYLDKIVSLGIVPVAANRLLALLVGVMLCTCCYIVIKKTLWGKAVRALIQDRDACQLVGINVRRIYQSSFAVAFSIAGVAGVLLSMFYPFSPFSGLSYTIIAFIVIILGGLGNVAAGLLAGFALGFVQTVTTTLMSPGFQSILSYLLFILVVLLWPRGIFNRGT